MKGEDMTDKYKMELICKFIKIDSKDGLSIKIEIEDNSN